MSYWPYWEGIMVEIEHGFRGASDEPSTLEHRIAKANGLEYGCPPRHWKWTQSRDASQPPPEED